MAASESNVNHYETLGVAHDASADDIKRAYRRKAMEHHPDRDGGSAERAAEVNEAYRVLSDPELRARYDATGSATAPPSRDEKVLEGLLHLFRNALKKDLGDPVTALRQDLVNAKEKARNAAAACDRRIERLKSLQGRLTRKGDKPNHFAAIINDELLVAEKDRDHQAEMGEQVVEALRMLSEYSVKGMDDMTMFFELGQRLAVDPSRLWVNHSNTSGV